MKKVRRQYPKIPIDLKLTDVFNNDNKDLLLLIKSNIDRPKGISLQKIYNYHKKSDFLRVIFSSAMYVIMHRIAKGDTFVFPEESTNATTRFFRSEKLKENYIIHCCSNTKDSVPMFVLPSNDVIEVLNKTQVSTGVKFGYVDIMGDLFKHFKYLDRDCLYTLVRASLVRFNNNLNTGSNTIAMFNTRLDKHKILPRLIFCKGTLLDTKGRLIQNKSYEKL